MDSLGNPNAPWDALKHYGESYLANNAPLQLHLVPMTDSVRMFSSMKTDDQSPGVQLTALCSVITTLSVDGYGEKSGYRHRAYAGVVESPSPCVKVSH